MLDLSDELCTMDQALQELLNRHWQFLTRYINPSEQLINILSEEKILPTSMIEDVKKGSNRKEKNERLLKSLKLRGNVSYRKFRDTMMKCDQVFIADLLWEEDTQSAPLVEAADVTSLPVINMSLSQEDTRQLVDNLNARIRGKILRNEWRRDSKTRSDSLLARFKDGQQEATAISKIDSLQTQVKKLQEEMKRKNDTIRSLSLEINVLNKEIMSFTQHHQLNATSSTDIDVASRSMRGDTDVTSRSHDTASPIPASMKGVPKRFQLFESALVNVVNRLRDLVGEEVPKEKRPVNMEDLDHKTKKVQQLVRELESSLDQKTADKEEAIGLLFPNDKAQQSLSVSQNVHKYLERAQQERLSLLQDIDRLSRKLRGITTKEHGQQQSALRALQQSAVTGIPDAEIVDHRFLSSHLALLESDAEHIAKKLSWKDAELRALRKELEEATTKPTKGGSSLNQVSLKEKGRPRATPPMY